MRVQISEHAEETQVHTYTNASSVMKFLQWFLAKNPHNQNKSLYVVIAMNPNSF